MEEKEDKNANKSNNKKIIICILVIIIVLIIIYFLVSKDTKNNVNNIVSPDMEIEEYGVQNVSVNISNAPAIAYDTYNQEEILYKDVALGGEIAYSIDYGAPESTSNALEFRKYLSDAGMAVLIKGYPNCTPEEMECVSQDEAYMATQMAIWEVMSRTGESQKATKIFRTENIKPVDGKEEVCNRIINAAKKLVSMAEDEPYKDVPTMKIDNANISIVKNIEDDALIGPYTVSITGTDSNTINYIRASLENAPESARITDENGNEKKLLVNGDSVYVRLSSGEEDTTFKIKFETSIDRKVGLIYEDVNTENQDYLKLETMLDNIVGDSTIIWSNVTTIGTIELTAIDNENNPVVGARFVLGDTEGKKFGTLDSGTDGKIKFYGVPIGEYVLEQISVPDGYEILDTSKNITVNGGETSNVTFVDEKTK